MSCISRKFRREKDDQLQEKGEGIKTAIFLFIDSIMFDNPLALIPTIDEDNDVPNLDGSDEDDEDQDEVLVKPRAHKLAQATKGKSVDFDDEFQFLVVNDW